MKKLICFCCCLYFTNLTAQVSLVNKLEDGRYTLSNEGASYFAKLSLDCTRKSSPHYFYRALFKKGSSTGPKDLWPSFYGCYDWHSAVHNHWALIKILKLYPTIPEATEIREKLELSFSKDKILVELDYVKNNEDGLFEFPYGQSWLLKVADELINWDDKDAKRWLNNLKPLTEYIVNVHLIVWPKTESVKLSGSHDSPALGISFAYDYALSSKNVALKKVLVKAAERFYGDVKDVPIEQEPFEYDFMSASLLVTDVMRKVLPKEKFISWLKDFCPDLFLAEQVNIPLQIKRSLKHDGYESHWDGYHLNRIWCLNGILKTFPEGTIDMNTKKEWVTAMNDMWDYAQESIGKGNYDIDHWLSSFSVFALIGYE